MSDNNIAMPALNPCLISINKISENSYNPNVVARPELDLLELSIREDGFTQPIVCYYDDKKDQYQIVDGFHRYKVAKERLDLKYVPIVLIEKSLENRMASTIRHNRARGTHQINGMATIVKILSLNDWNNEYIATKLGMDLEEVLRLKQSTGLKEAFSNHQFSKSWEQFEKKYYQ